MNDKIRIRVGTQYVNKISCATPSLPRVDRRPDSLIEHKASRKRFNDAVVMLEFVVAIGAPASVISRAETSLRNAMRDAR